MGFRNKFMNKVDNYKSKHSEKSDINDLDSQIKDEKNKIDETIMQLGKYYWDLYNAENTDFIPPEDAKEMFETIENCILTINDLEKEKEARALSGEEERKKNDEETAQREEEERQRKEEARMQREAERAAKRAEREEKEAAAAAAAASETKKEEDDDLF